MRNRTLLTCVLLSSVCFAQNSSLPKELAQKSSLPKELQLPGRWDASLNNSTEEVPFGLEIKNERGKWSASVLNGPEVMRFTTARYEHGTFTARFEQYDGTLTANVRDGKLVGEYFRPYAKGIVHYPFQARPQRIQLPIDRVAGSKPRVETVLNGRYLYKLISEKQTTAESGEAEFSTTPEFSGNNLITGVMIPVSGDSGLLAGRSILSTSSAEFEISRFDGIHVMLLKGEVEPDGSIKGNYESGKTARLTFTATRKEAAKKEDQPGDPFALTTVKDPNEPFQFSAPDPRTGKTVSASDPEFKNKVVIVDIMGTWCPNCHDEEPLLVELWNRYHKDGLEIVGLAYEYTDDAARNARQIEIFRKKYNVPYPILIAGTTDDGQVQKTLPQLVNFGAFPTTIFIGRDGRVSKIHAGYTGPATGERFPQVQKELDEIVRELVKAPATTAAR
jgi:thiol-disulfide isomerase/thioredoxin